MKGGEPVDINAIASVVGSLGFPIVACGALFWKMNKFFFNKF